MTLILALAAAALCSCGTYLVLQRQLSRVVIGIALLGHGANTLLILSAGGRGRPAFGGGAVTDPLPQALVLTAIVITFGAIAFLLALAYRSWLVSADDEVEDDLEDRFIARHETRLEDATVMEDMIVGEDRS
jgi:multicomponent Na+:H+ antiporter subunit C